MQHLLLKLHFQRWYRPLAKLKKNIDVTLKYKMKLNPKNYFKMTINMKQMEYI